MIIIVLALHDELVLHCEGDAEWGPLAESNQSSSKVFQHLFDIRARGARSRVQGHGDLIERFVLSS